MSDVAALLPPRSESPTSLQEYERELDVSLADIVNGFSNEERELCRWLAEDADTFDGFVALMIDRFTNDAVTDKYFELVAKKTAGRLSAGDRQVGAVLLVHELRVYAGHSMNVFTDKPHYELILTRVHSRLAKQFKKKVAKVASIQSREEAIANFMIDEAVNRLSSDEVDAALKGMELDFGESSARDALLLAMKGSGLVSVGKLLGKKMVKEIVLSVLERFLVKQLGKDAAKKILGQVAKKVAQKTFQQALGFVGWALLAKDVIDLGGEATRVTMPFIINVSIRRTLARMPTGQS